jgi:hypothetical protein
LKMLYKKIFKKRKKRCQSKKLCQNSNRELRTRTR